MEKKVSQSLHNVVLCETSLVNSGIPLLNSETPLFNSGTLLFNCGTPLVNCGTLLVNCETPLVNSRTPLFKGVVIRLCKLNLLRGKALMAPLKLSPEGGDKKVRFT